MFKLNVEAVNQRYGQGEAERFRPLDYKFRYELVGSIQQAIKSLECWLYQCTEGTVHEHPVYQIMRDYLHNLMAAVVHMSAKYQQAEWS